MILVVFSLNGERLWEYAWLTRAEQLSNTRRITVSEYNKNNMVSIREYYEKDGNMLPGKKVSTSMKRRLIELVADQWCE